jgi:hypothetical protein
LTAPGLISVIGLPRSGTSWLGKVFDSHPDTEYRHEPDKHVRSVEVPGILPLAELPAREAALRSFVGAVLASRHPDVVGKRPHFAKRHRGRARAALRSTLAAAAKCLPEPIRSELSIPELISRPTASPRLVWKSINGVGRIGALATLLPQARFLLLCRHPGGQIASILRGVATGKLPALPADSGDGQLATLVSSDHGRRHGLAVDGLRELGVVERMTWRWVLFMEKALEEIELLPNCRLVSYEALCASPVPLAREVFRFAGLGWEPQSERFVLESSSARPSGGFFGVHRQSPQVAGRWRSELEPAQVEAVTEVLSRSRLHVLWRGDSVSAAPALAPGPGSLPSRVMA